jgi:hypothetical protein
MIDVGDIYARAHAADTEPPILFASKEIAEEWVLVPRRHFKAIQSFDVAIYGPGEEQGDDINGTKAILMLAEILADARLLGVDDE